VASIRVGSDHFSPDTVDFLRLLHRHGVRYLVVGGEAVIFHGHARLTGDVDVLFGREVDNAARVYAVLDEFWGGRIPGGVVQDELTTDGLILQFGVPPNRIDLINSIEGVSFEEAWRGRVEAVLVSPDGEVPLPYIGLEDLIANKRAAGRPKDLDDAAYLDEARRRQ
jgi:hypothetical protein